MKFTHITTDDRKHIEAWLKAGLSKRTIAELLEKDYSTICREIKRGTVTLVSENPYYKEYAIYQADYAQNSYQKAASRKGRKSKLSRDLLLKDYIETKVKTGYSPEVALQLYHQTHTKLTCTICFKTVYNALDRNEFTQITNNDLPYRKPQKQPKKRRKINPVPENRRSIEERPALVLKRNAFGHWEMDCVLSGQCTTSKEALLVLTERKTRYSLIFKLPRKTQTHVKTVIDHLESCLGDDFNRIFKTITMDNGTEFINQSFIEDSIKPNKKRVTAFYCHPYSSFERGSNENWNRFIRRFIPKGSDIKNYSDLDVKRVADFINNYPRKMFKFQSSAYYLKKEISKRAFLVINGN